jgi:hypothetical protein
MPENTELNDAIRNIETRFRVETYLIKLGASEEAAKLIASSPDQIKKFVYDGVDLRFGKSDLTAADDPNARAHFLDGPFKGLFAVPADKTNGDGDTQIDDPRLLTLARGGNKKVADIAKGLLLRDSFNGDVKALDAALADNGDGHDKPLDKSTNPFIGLRDKSGKIVPEKMKAVESLIRGAGTSAAVAIAKSAGLRLDGTPIPEQYL